MNADRVNRWLTLGANIGVLIGIILLLVELDQNRDLARAQIHQDRSDAWVASRFARADSEFVAPIMEKIYAAGYPENMKAMDDLTPVELWRMHDVFSAFAGDYDNLYFQYQQGYLDEDFYKNRIEPSIRSMAPWWEKLGITAEHNLEKEIERMTEERE
jgi:hypothetical protein